MNANDSKSSKLLFEEFVVGFPAWKQNSSDGEDSPKLAELYTNLRASYEMIDKFPFILFSSQNCSDMIIAAGESNTSIR